MNSDAREREVRIPAAGIIGDLVVPRAAIGLVIFAHGSGSGRFSSRNRQVARALQEDAIATLLLDLLRPDEEGQRDKVFDVELLAERLVAATRWVAGEGELSQLAVGYFGASTGAGAALIAASALPVKIDAVVSRGGRPDLAAARLHRVSAPTLLIVGGHDAAVLELNRRALEELGGVAELEVVPEANHLFEEPGALEQVSRLAGTWFMRYLAG